MRKRLRSHPHLRSMMREKQRQVQQLLYLVQPGRWTPRQQPFLQRPAQRQHRRL